jgi:hypothetical protein
MNTRASSGVNARGTLLTRRTRGLPRWLLLVWLCAGSDCALALGFEGQRTNCVLLNGSWEFVRGDGNEGVETAAAQDKLAWKQVTLPGPFMPWNQELAHQTQTVWARRAFTVLAFLEDGRLGNSGVENRGASACAPGLNRYRSDSGRPVLFGNKNLAAWPAGGQDANRLVTDPWFVDAARGDVRLQPAPFIPSSARPGR